MLYVALYALLRAPPPDIFVCDQVSACIPVLRLARNRKKVLFYCHFPDQLLTKRESLLKRIYRAPLDWLEEYTTGMADCIVVNSEFTANVFADTFKSLSHIKPDVLYPSLTVSAFESIVPVEIANPAGQIQPKFLDPWGALPDIEWPCALDQVKWDLGSNPID
ncbi:alpha-1,3/1,6-mannosyltransferase ALG2 [Alligator mississippiensis]|uniref:Alpha-1,3/1,6-mannosyltransferase ALG2 n=1 Tax=Alligator mississippiensis TaxID=8496 RepID=A0A151PHG7_ALLMI|nr:alpha-1,3/1,6-mannosyltransferase ALG2 [Alligator mississippiensis]